MSGSKIYKICLCLAIYLPIPLGGPRDVALCVGADGHWGIKYYAPGRCVPTPKAGLPAKPQFCSQGSSLQDDECGPCTDIPLSVHGDAQVSRRTAGPSLQGENPLAAATGIWHEEYIASPRAESVPVFRGGNPDHVSLATIVLLI